MVGVRMGADDEFDVAAGGAPQPLDVRRIGRAGVDGDVAGARVAHQVAVGAGAGHEAGVGRGEALHVLQQRHGLVGLPVELVQQLPVGADQFQLAEGRLVLHVARLLAGQPAGARAAGPQRVLAGAGGQHRVHGGVHGQALQGADGGVDDEELARFVARQRVGGAHPHGLELLGLVGHGRLAFGHAGDEKGHIEAARQVAVGDPVRQHVHVGGGQREAAPAALRHEGRVAVERGDVVGAGGRAVGMAGQQHAQFLEALADGGDGLGEVFVALRGAARGVGVGSGVGRVDAAAGEHVGAGREAGGERAARHQHLDAGGRVAQQQHGGGGARRRGVALRMQELAGAGHGPIMGAACARGCRAGGRDEAAAGRCGIGRCWCRSLIRLESSAVSAGSGVGRSWSERVARAGCR